MTIISEVNQRQQREKSAAEAGEQTQRPRMR